MGNETSLQFYETLAGEADGSGSEKLKMGAVAVKHDIAFIQKHSGTARSLLDIGSGSGLILNQIHEAYDRVLAIEPTVKLAQFIKGANIEVDTSNIFDFAVSETFDLITLFGVCHHFNSDEAAQVYQIVADHLAEGGRVLVKNQFGTEATVTADHFSEELGQHYYAQYRSMEDEAAILKQAGLKIVETVDIYPAEMNRWPNTHYYALVIERAA